MDGPSNIVKRDGRIVPFDIERIRVSIKKSMIAKNTYNPQVLEKVVKDVMTTVNELFREKTPSVEEVQDIIEVSLMKNKLFEVAKAYILYRSKKTEIREEKKKVLNKGELDEVDKKFSVNALRLLAARYLIKDEKGMPVETPKEMFQRVALSMSIPEIFYDTKVYSKEPVFIIKKEDADVETSKYANKLDEYDRKYTLNGWPISKWHFERMIAVYRELVHEGRIKVSFGKLLEMLERGEFKEAERVAQKAFDLMTNKDFMPNTPTLVNAGRKLGMLSACFTLDVDDNMESIMKLARDCAMVHKSGGGTGMNFSKLRPEGDIVASTTGVASGPVSFMKMIDAVSEVIKQGGVRRAANMGILEIWHPDIEKFITSKQNEGVLENFNISVGINKDFWEYLEREDAEYPLRDPRSGKVVRKVDARKLFNLIAYNAWATADPGVLFFDVINRRNVMKGFMGEVKVTNPCGEEPLYPYESCNLASVNVSNFVIRTDSGEYEFDWERFHDVTKFVARVLDNVICINKYPIEEIDAATKKSRRIGVGVMGVANALFLLKKRYNSREGFAFMKKIAEHLTYYAFEQSTESAATRGTFPLYEMTDYKKGELPIEGFYHREEWTCDWDSLVEKIKKNGLRNAMVTTAPPTGSIGMIADTSTGIEPIFSLAFEKRVSVGSFYYMNEIFEEELKKTGKYSNELVKKIVENYGSLQGLDEDIPEEMKNVFVTSMDIHWADHIMAQASMQMWITDSISKTINMPSDATVEDVEQAYLIAHELNCKGITIYRNESKSRQVLNVSGNVKKKEFSTRISEYTSEILAKIIESKPYLKDYIKIELGTMITQNRPVMMVRAVAKDASAEGQLDNTVEARSKLSESRVGVDGGLTSIAKAEIIQMGLSNNGGVLETVVAGNKPDLPVPVLVPTQKINATQTAAVFRKLDEGKYCPQCLARNELSELVNEGGCKHCPNPNCGWSACTIS